jgi:hypothetical protein
MDPRFRVVGDVVMIEYFEGFPNAASKTTWARLHQEFPDSPMASVALYRHALLEARAGQVGTAIGLLTDLVERFGSAKSEEAAGETATGWHALIDKRPAHDSLGIKPALAVQKGRKLLDLLTSNRVAELEPYYEYPVLRRLLGLNPLHPSYVRGLKELLLEITPTSVYSPTRLRDNIALLIVLEDPSLSRQIAELEGLVAKYEEQPEADALARTRYELGLAYAVDSRPDEARELFGVVIEAHADSPWAYEAQRQLATMGQPVNDEPVGEE